MPTPKAKLIHIVIAAAIAGVVFLLVSTGGQRGLQSLSVCHEDVKKEVASPSGHYIAQVYYRSCGGSGNEATHVNMSAASVRNPVDANGIIAAGDVVVMPGHQPIDIVWRGDTKLQIQGNGPVFIGRILSERWMAVEIEVVAGGPGNHDSP